MSGYRQSSFDPEAYQTMGKPLRPFNWVQWTGVAVQTVGIALMLVDFAEMVGWLPQWADMPPFAAIMLLIIGVSLINSRREPSVDVTPEQRAANRRLLLITIAICAAILGLAAAIDFLGA